MKDVQEPCKATKVKEGRENKKGNGENFFAISTEGSESGGLKVNSGLSSSMGYGKKNVRLKEMGNLTQA